MERQGPSKLPQSPPFSPDEAARLVALYHLALSPLGFFDFCLRDPCRPWSLRKKQPQSGSEQGALRVGEETRLRSEHNRRSGVQEEGQPASLKHIDLVEETHKSR